MMRPALVVLLVAAFLAAASLAPAAAFADNGDSVIRGDQYFKRGHYLRASEEYRVAALADQVSPWKKLAFGHALFAVGNYSYAEYALRRGVSSVRDKSQFRVDVVGLFPSRRAFSEKMRDLKRYVTYAPRDPSGLTVLGYMYYASGAERESAEIFRILKRLNPEDDFAGFFLELLNEGDGEAGPLVRPERPPEAPPAPEPLDDIQPSAPIPEAREGDGPEVAGGPGGPALPPGGANETEAAPKPESPTGLRSGESTVKGKQAPKPAVAR